MEKELKESGIPLNSTDTLAAHIQMLCEKYGQNRLDEIMKEYTDAINKMNTLNQELLLIDAKARPDDYVQKVDEAMTATRRYYDVMGVLNEDFRRFFTLFMENLKEEENPSTIPYFGAEVDMSPLLSIQSVRPKTYTMQIDAVTNQLTRLSENRQIRIRARRDNQPLKTTVTLDMPEHMLIDGGGQLSTYDKSIINGVTSLLESGNTVFSIPMLYHAMTGKQNPTVDDQMTDEIGGKLEKMRRMTLAIDLSGENRIRYVTNEDGEQIKVEELSIEGYLLPLNKMSGIINGKKTEVYQLIQTPPLYAYSKMKRQLASAPIELLNAPLNNNSTTIPLKTYLLQRVELMKNRRNSIQSTSILYESIYTELDAADSNKTKKMRIRAYTATILRYFAEKQYIKGYCEYRRGRSIAGVNIIL